MVGQYQGGDQDKDPRVILDRLEHILAKLTSMVSQCLVAKCGEAP